MTAAANAAITVVPKLLTSPCTARMPRFMMDCCRQVSAEKPAISRMRLRRRRTAGSRRTSAGNRTQVYAAMPRPETYCAMTVASAAPATPRPSPATNHRSSTMLSPAENGQKRQRRGRIAKRAQQRSKKVVQENGGQPGKDHAQIVVHHGDELGRGAQRPNDPVQPRVDGDVQGRPSPPPAAQRTPERSLSGRSRPSGRSGSKTPCRFPSQGPAGSRSKTSSAKTPTPRAASAPAPRNRPTISVSAML